MGGDRRPPQGRDRAIGAQLRAIRLEYTELTADQAAREIGWSGPTLSRTENGKRHIPSEDVAALLMLYRVPRPLREQMIDNAKIGCQAGWWSREIAGILPDLGTLASYEADARAITDWSVTLIPGLLHTREYAAGFMRTDGFSQADIDVRWKARELRQEVLTRVDYTAFLHEHVLHLPFGGHDAFKSQLRHLYEGYDRGLGIRVVRIVDAALAHSWMLLEFPRASPVVSIDLVRSGLFLYDDEVAPYQAIREKMAKAALSAAESRQVIARVLERF
ncbi:helix-turn-helix domain-containing protein [Actinokineospora guangxiensis]|uniref:Helix-turn-helix domain-containing protein n=1 Tax=Actinokineospora guangxiensis TaxID=1490288 RepID=A0ABW0EIX2_9PSEU